MSAELLAGRGEPTGRIHTSGRSVKLTHYQTLGGCLIGYHEAVRVTRGSLHVPTMKEIKRAPSPDAATLGEPSYVWRSGQERRLQLIRRYVELDERWILDVGCGIGTYVRRFRDFTPHSYGLDVSAERLGQAGLPNLVAGEGETLPFADASFDVIVFNEVIEHVRDDRRAIADAVRILRPGGHVVIYAPNRLYPFETHGIYWRGRYRFGNKFGVNWLPDGLRHKLVPHAKAYRAGDMMRLWSGLPVKLVVHAYVYPGFDNIATRSPRAGKALRSILYRAEATPVRRFGLSHFVVLQKLQAGSLAGSGPPDRYPV